MNQIVIKSKNNVPKHIVLSGYHKEYIDWIIPQNFFHPTITEDNILIVNDYFPIEDFNIKFNCFAVLEKYRGTRMRPYIVVNKDEDIDVPWENLIFNFQKEFEIKNNTIKLIMVFNFNNVEFPEQFNKLKKVKKDVDLVFLTTNLKTYFDAEEQTINLNKLLFIRDKYWWSFYNHTKLSLFNKNTQTEDNNW